MDHSDLPTTPKFSVGGEVAAFMATCGILVKAWEICTAHVSQNNVDYILNENEGVAYVTFPLFSTEDFDIVTDSSRSYGPYDMMDENIFYDCLKGEADNPALVHPGALNRFRQIFQGSDFKEEMKGLKAQTIIFVGRFMGGAVATLSTLCYLQMRVKGKSYFCITFGSPLVGNAILGEAIGGQGWVGNFCHVVSNFDIVPRSPYRPFGTYMFCSAKGASCIDDSEAVLKMLQLTMQGGSCASAHTDYRQILEAVTNALLNAAPIANTATDPFEVGITLELEAMAIGAQKPDASIALRKAGVKKNEQDITNMILNEELNKMQRCMAKVEWYKNVCKRRCGYYDSFKQAKETQYTEVNNFREELEGFWREKIVEKTEEKHVLPSDLRSRNKWINAGTAYRRLVEPLDIAHHYRTRKDTRPYLSDGVRPRQYKVLEKWMKEKEQTRGDKGKKDRTMFASMTSDSCFWARVEESSLALAGNPQFITADLVVEEREFQNRIWNMIEEKSISEEVFLEGSSFMSWWKKSKTFFTRWEKGNPSSSDPLSSSKLYCFMENKKWK